MVTDDAPSGYSEKELIECRVLRHGILILLFSFDF